MPKGVYPKRACRKGCGAMVDPRAAFYHERKCRGPEHPGPLPKVSAKPRVQSPKSNVQRLETSDVGRGTADALGTVTAGEVMDELRRCSEQSAWAVNPVRVAAERVVRRRGARPV